MSPEEFLARLPSHELSLARSGGNLLLRGPKAARHDRIRAYIKQRKADLLRLLADEADKEPAEPIEEIKDPFAGDTWQELLEPFRYLIEAARDGALPASCDVRVSPGVTICHPGTATLAASRSLRRLVEAGRGNTTDCALELQRLCVLRDWFDAAQVEETAP